jgi:hypothetical protein
LPAEGQAQASPKRQKPSKNEKLRTIKLLSEVEQQINHFGMRPPKPKPSDNLASPEFQKAKEDKVKALLKCDKNKKALGA